MVSKNQLPYTLEQATVVSYDPRDPRSIAIRVSGGRVIRNCMSSGGAVSVGSTVMAVISHYDNCAIIIGSVQNSASIAANGTEGSNVALNPPSGLRVTHTVREIGFHWDFYPGNDKICYQVQHNAAGAEDGNEVSALVTKGSSFFYDCPTPGGTRYFRVRSLQWISAGNVLYSAWGAWTQGTALSLVVSDLPEEAALIADLEPGSSLFFTNATIATDRYELSPSYTVGSLVELTKESMATGVFCSFEALASDIGADVITDGVFKATFWAKSVLPPDIPPDQFDHVALGAVVHIQLIRRDAGAVETILCTVSGGGYVPESFGKIVEAGAVASMGINPTDTLIVRVIAIVDILADNPITHYYNPDITLGLYGSTLSRVDLPLHMNPVAGTPSGGGHAIQNAGTPLPAQPILNFSSDFDVADGAGKTDISIVFPPPSGGGHEIQNAGTPLPDQPILNFSADFNIVDGVGKTEISIAFPDPAPRATVEEADGTPSVMNVAAIRVGNGDLVDEGEGVVRLKTASDVAPVVVGRYRQFVYAVSDGDFFFVKIADGHPVTVLSDLE